MAEVVQLCCSQARAATSTEGAAPAAPACPSHQDPAAESRRRESAQQQEQQQAPGHSLTLHLQAAQPPLDAAADGSNGGPLTLSVGPRSGDHPGCDDVWQGTGLSSSGSGSRTDPLGVPRLHGAAIGAPAEACRGDGGAGEGAAACVPAQPEGPVPLPVLAAG